jgi:hypothetical protein
VTNSGINDNGIYWPITTESESIGNDDGCMWPESEIVSRSSSKVRVNFDRCHATAPPNNLCQDSTVVAGASTDVNDMRPGWKAEMVIKPCPKGWLAIIDAARLVERY